MHAYGERRAQILISHVNPLVAAGLAAALQSQRDVDVIGSCTAGSLLEAVESMPPRSIVVADFDAAMTLLSQSDLRRYRVLIVTDTDSELAIRRAVELGAAGYLPLTCTVEAVMRAVRCLHGGGTMIDPVFISRIAASLASPSLTNRELEVLQLMTEGLSNKAIAIRLKRSVGTAKSHVKAILAKLDATTRVEAVAIAQRRGLISAKSTVRAPIQPRWPAASGSHSAALMLAAER